VSARLQQLTAADVAGGDDDVEADAVETDSVHRC